MAAMSRSLRSRSSCFWQLLFELIGLKLPLSRDQFPRRIHLPPNVPKQHTPHAPLMLIVKHTFLISFLPISDDIQARIQFTDGFVPQLKQVGVEKRQVVVWLSASGHV